MSVDNQIKQLNEVLEPKGFVAVNKKVLQDLYQRALSLELRLDNIEDWGTTVSDKNYKKEESKDLTEIIRNMIEGK